MFPMRVTARRCRSSLSQAANETKWLQIFPQQRVGANAVSFKAEAWLERIESECVGIIQALNASWSHLPLLRDLFASCLAGAPGQHLLQACQAPIPSVLERESERCAAQWTIWTSGCLLLFKFTADSTGTQPSSRAIGDGWVGVAGCRTHKQ